MPKCAFCGGPFLRGTGLLFVKRDGTAFFFCSSKCKKNALKLGRSPFDVKWTGVAQSEKKAEERLSESRGKTVRRRGRARKR